MKSIISLIILKNLHAAITGYTHTKNVIRVLNELQQKIMYFLEKLNGQNNFIFCLLFLSPILLLTATLLFLLYGRPVILLKKTWWRINYILRYISSDQ